jgi:putative endopeptidase
MQPPFFGANADDAVDYGAIGGAIGHEMSHGFDDQGSQYDGDGNLRDRGRPQGIRGETEVLVAQYGAYSPILGSNVNCELTLGENFGDNSAVAIAYMAYKLSRKGMKAPVIDA